jgi:hypothetical protein
MARKDPRVDPYIAKSAPFARPILKRVRKVVHAACPEVEETMKWSVPHFDYRGEMMCAMAAFKAHCGVNFWKGALVVGSTGKEKDAAGQLGRITSLADLPSDKTLAAFEAFPPSHKREYVEWIIEGKSRNWKYERK